MGTTHGRRLRRRFIVGTHVIWRRRDAYGWRSRGLVTFRGYDATFGTVVVTVTWKMFEHPRSARWATGKTCMTLPLHDVSRFFRRDRQRTHRDGS